MSHGQLNKAQLSCTAWTHHISQFCPSLVRLGRSGLLVALSSGRKEGKRSKVSQNAPHPTQNAPPHPTRILERSGPNERRERRLQSQVFSPLALQNLDALWPAQRREGGIDWEKGQKRG